MCLIVWFDWRIVEFLFSVLYEALLLLIYSCHHFSFLVSNCVGGCLLFVIGGLVLHCSRCGAFIFLLFLEPWCGAVFSAIVSVFVFIVFVYAHVCLHFLFLGLFHICIFCFICFVF